MSISNAVFHILDFALGCHHSELSRVFTIKKRTYKVCFKCGGEIAYSWTLMRPVRRNPRVTYMQQRTMQAEAIAA